MNKVRKQWRERGIMPEVLLFGFVLVLMAIRFYGLFQNAELPGWDTPSHFFVLQKMAAEYLPQGHITGYVHEWLGGMPLFQFYAPFFFILVSGVWLITFKLISLALLFRIFIFLSLFGVSISFYYFLRCFFSRSVARFGIVISSLYIFYPKIYAILGGIGAGAGIWAGLISGIVGLSFVLLWLSFLEKLRKKQSLFYFILASISVCLLIITHTLSFISGVLAFVVYLIYHFKDRTFLGRSLLSFILGIGLSAFWLIPFIVNLDLASAGVRGFSQWPFNLFYLLFFFQIPYFSLSAVIHLLLALSGFVLLIKARQLFVPFLFGIATAFIILRGAIADLFPNITIHYTRFLPIVYIALLAMMTYCLNWLWKRRGSKRIRRKMYVGILLGLLIFHSFASFDVNTRLEQDKGFGLMPIKWRWEDFIYNKEADEVLEKLGQLDDVSRIFVEMPGDKSLALIGSMNYFTTQIPLKNHQSIITGGYPESSPLTPFILPTLDAFTGGRLLLWADTRLQIVLPFYQQDIKIHFERLKRFGVNYIVAYSPDFISTLESLEGVVLVDGTEHFKIFKVDQSYSFAYPSFAKPGLYINADGTIPFRDIALALFSGEYTFDIPIVNGNFNVDELNQDILKRFSALIISGSELKGSDIERLKVLDHPLIIINPNKAVKTAFDRSNVHTIDKFEIIPKARRNPYAHWPSGWKELQNSVRLTSNNFYYKAKSIVKAEKITSEYIEISGSGPIIINAGYSPYWRYQDCKTCEVFHVTPANMMIFSTGNAILKYSYDNTKVIGIVISLLSLFIVFFILFFGRK